MAALALAVGLAPGCSHALGLANGGIPLLERGPTPVSQLARGAKVTGWLLSAPLVLACVPLAVLAWATPWVDLPLAVDLITAPGLALGYATQALVGFPLYGALFWTEGRAGVRPPGPERERPLRPGVGTFVPWGLVVEHRPVEARPRAPRPLSAELAEAYAAPPERVAALAASLGPRPFLRERRRLPLPGDPTSTLELWTAEDVLEGRADRGRRPLVLMTPPSQANFAARYLAGWFAARGFHAAVLVQEEVFLTPDLSPLEVEAKLRRTLIEARAIAAALGARPEVERLVYLGVSAGGIFGSLLLAVEPRIERAVLVLPGGDLARLVQVSEESSVTAYREAWAARGVPPAALAAAFAREVRTEPLALAPYVDPRRVLLFLGAQDRKVPIEGGLALREALGRPETYVLAGNHETASVSFGFVLRRAHEFLSAPPPR